MSYLRRSICKTLFTCGLCFIASPFLRATLSGNRILRGAENVSCSRRRAGSDMYEIPRPRRIGSWQGRGLSGKSCGDVRTTGAGGVVSRRNGVDGPSGCAFPVLRLSRPESAASGGFSDPVPFGAEIPFVSCRRLSAAVPCVVAFRYCFSERYSS